MDGIMSCVQTGHLSTHWDQISAATGRLSSYQPNVQAIPKAPIVVSNYKDNFIVGMKWNAVNKIKNAKNTTPSDQSKNLIENHRNTDKINTVHFPGLVQELQ